MVGMTEFINTDFLECCAIGFIAGATVAGLIVAIRCVVKVFMRIIRKA